MESISAEVGYLTPGYHEETAEEVAGTVDERLHEYADKNQTSNSMVADRMLLDQLEETDEDVLDLEAGPSQPPQSYPKSSKDIPEQSNKCNTLTERPSTAPSPKSSEKKKVDVRIRPWSSPSKSELKKPHRLAANSIGGAGKTTDPPSLAKAWKHFRIMSKNTMLLRGNLSLISKVFSGKCYGKQCAAMSIVALAYSRIFEMETWHSSILDKILQEGNKLYLASVKKMKTRQDMLGVRDVLRKFHVEEYSVAYGLSAKPLMGRIRFPQDLAHFLDLFEALKLFFVKHGKGIITFKGDNYAFWSKNKAIYLFNPRPCDETGFPTQDGTERCSLFRLDNIRTLAFVLEGILDSAENEIYQITNFEIISMRETEKQTRRTDEKMIVSPKIPDIATNAKLHNRLIGKRPKSKLKFCFSDKLPVIEESEHEVSGETQGDGDHVVAVPSLTVPSPPPRDEPPLDEFTALFKKISGPKGVRLGTLYDENNRNKITNTFILFGILHFYKSHTLPAKIIDEVVVRSDELFKEIIAKRGGGTTLCLPYFTEPFVVRDRQFLPVVMEKVILGRLFSDDPPVPDLWAGLTTFFDHHTHGILQGPVVATIWSEGGFYYMFIIEKCDENGVIVYSTDDKDKGAACMTWYPDLQALVKGYYDVIDMETRTSPYSISAVEVEPSTCGFDPWLNWKGITKGRWIMQGRFHQTTEVEELTPTKATVTLAFVKLSELTKCTTSETDHLMLDNFSRKCIKFLEEENKLREVQFLMAELLNQIREEDKQVNLDFEENEQDVIAFRKSFGEFFMLNDVDKVSVDSISMGVWQNREVYYCYNPMTAEQGSGYVCVMRILNVNEPDIGSPISPNTLHGMSPPPLNHFIQLSETSAILFDNLHEGRLIFRDQRNRQTILNIAVSFAMSTLIPVTIWTRNFISFIIKNGDKIFRELNENYGDGHLEVNVETMDYELNLGIHKVFMTHGGLWRGVYLPEYSGNSFLDLKTCVSGYFDREDKQDGVVYAILLSKIYTVGLWKDGGVCYLFDPKSCDEFGRMSDNRILEFIHNLDRTTRTKTVGNPDDDEYDKSGASFQEFDDNEPEDSFSACLLRFMSVNDLLGHILTNIPLQCWQHQFKFVEMFMRQSLNSRANEVCLKPSEIITADKVGLQIYNNFKEIYQNIFILLGTYSQSGQIFPNYPNRGNQDLCNCISALVFRKCYWIEQWKSDSIDAILKHGDQLYTASFLRCQKAIENDLLRTSYEIRALKLQHHYVVSNFKFGGFYFDIKINEHAIIGDVLPVEKDTSTFSLLQALELYFIDKNNAILTAKYYSVCIWKIGKHFFLFDPHECDRVGLRTKNGVAYCLLAPDLQSIVNLFMTNISRYTKDKSGVNLHNLYSISSVDILARKPRIGVDVVTLVGHDVHVQDTAFETLLDGRRILRSNLSKNIYETNGSDGAPFAVVATAMCFFQDPDQWTSSTLDEVLKVGAALEKETSNVLGGNRKRMITISILNRIFVYADRLVRWDFHGTVKGFIEGPGKAVNTLQEVLTLFFQNKCRGIFNTASYTLSFWRYNNLYYLYNPYDSGRLGDISGDGVSCLLSFNTLEQLYRTILQNIPKSCRCKPFTLRGLKITILPKPKIDENRSCFRPSGRDLGQGQGQGGPTKGFLALSDDVEIMYGDFSQNFVKFDVSTRNKQCMANALVAVAMGKLRRPKFWNVDVVNNILVCGDKLLKESMLTRGDPVMSILDVLRNFKVDNFFVEVNVYEARLGGVVSEINVRAALDKFFVNDVSGAFVANDVAFAIFKRNNLFYCFDPFDRSESGLPIFEGVACLMRFRNSISLAMALTHKLNLDPYNLSLSFDIFPIDVVQVIRIK